MPTISRICSPRRNMRLSSRYASWRKDITSWSRRAMERSTCSRRLRPSICPSWRRPRLIIMLTRIRTAQEAEILQALIYKWEASVKKHKRILPRLIQKTIQTSRPRRAMNNWKPCKIWWLKWRTRITLNPIQPLPTKPTASSPSGSQWSNSWACRTNWTTWLPNLKKQHRR